jgi:hypothetical protein
VRSAAQPSASISMKRFFYLFSFVIFFFFFLRGDSIQKRRTRTFSYRTSACSCTRGSVL